MKKELFEALKQSIREFLAYEKALNQMAKIIPKNYIHKPKLHLLPIEIYQTMCRVYLDEYPEVYLRTLDWKLENLIQELYCNPFEQFQNRFMRKE